MTDARTGNMHTRNSSSTVMVNRTLSLWSLVALTTAFACVASSASATVLATDHFLGGLPGDPLLGEYDLTTNLNQLRRGNANGGGQNPTVAGFVDPWSGNVTSGTLGVAQWTVQVDGISGSPYSQGGRVRFSGVDNLQRRVQRTLAEYAPVNTYYLSVISQVLTDEIDLDGFVGVGFTNTGATVSATDANIVGGNGLRGLLIGAAGNGVGTDYVVRHVGSTGAVQNDVILSNIVQNNSEGSPFTRHTVIKLEFNDDPENPAGNSKLTIWQDPVDVSSEAAATAAMAPLELRTFALSANTDLTHLTLAGVDYSRAASFDEPRLATSWDSVIGGTADFNEDGSVDGNDFLVWQRNVGIDSGALYGQGDGNRDGAVNGQDLALWKFYFAEASDGAPELAAAIPEPSSIAMCLLGAIGIQFGRNRRSNCCRFLAFE